MIREIGICFFRFKPTAAWAANTFELPIIKEIGICFVRFKPTAH
jgi:hypothetical protein